MLLDFIGRREPIDERRRHGHREDYAALGTPLSSSTWGSEVVTLPRVLFCRCESGGLDVLSDGVLKGFECLSDFGFGGWFVGVEQGSEEPVCELGVEDGDADTVGVRTLVFLGGMRWMSPCNRRRRRS